MSDYNELPRYGLIEAFFSPGCELIPEGEEIEWTGAPNEAMEPLNEPARQRVKEWKAKLPGRGAYTFENMMRAAQELSPKHGEKELTLPEFAAKTLERAIELSGAERSGPIVPDQLNTPTRPESIPLTGADPKFMNSSARNAMMAGETLTRVQQNRGGAKRPRYVNEG